MSRAVLDHLTGPCGCPLLDQAGAESFLSDPSPALLLFLGDVEQRRESVDVAIVMRELIAAYQGRLRVGLVRRDAEAALKPRFGIKQIPSVVAVAKGETQALLPNILDWSAYRDAVDALLAGT